MVKGKKKGVKDKAKKRKSNSDSDSGSGTVSLPVLLAGIVCMARMFIREPYRPARCSVFPSFFCRADRIGCMCDFIISISISGNNVSVGMKTCVRIWGVCDFRW